MPNIPSCGIESGRKMKIQVLVAAMHQKDATLLERMNIQSDVIVGNQCDRYEIQSFLYHGFHARVFSFAERGVGLNRNNALMRADADVVLFADEDMRFLDGYPELVEAAWKRHPDADVLIFNLGETERDSSVNRYIIRRDHRIGWGNFLRYGTARVAVKLHSVKKNAIYFNQCFGGGTEHRHGEDSLFLAECLKRGLKLYAVTETLAVLNAGEVSSWNTGYDEKYLCDQGILYRTLSHRWWLFLCVQDAVRKAKRYQMPWHQALRWMIKGVKTDERDCQCG